MTLSEACIGGRASKLVDQRFLRALDERERTTLEAHLAGCAACSERYRRIHLAERVAAAGPEQSAEEPSPLEIERIAADLGLVETAPRGWFTPRAWSWWSALVTASAAAAALFFGVILWTPPGADDAPSALDGHRALGRTTPQAPDAPPVARGVAPAPATPGEPPARASFTAYVLGAQGGARPHDPAVPVRRDDHLKLRASWTGAAAPGRVRVLIAPREGPCRLAELEPPGAAATPGAPVTVPGAIALEGLPAGRAEAFVLASESLAAADLVARCSHRRTAPERWAEIETRSAERFEIEVAR